MIEVTGDLWEHPAQVHAITTNGTIKKDGSAVMGAGCAREARERFSGIDATLGGLLATHGNRCFRIVWERRTAPQGTFKLKPQIILTFPVKHQWNQKADRQLIADSCMQAHHMANRFGWESIVLPRPGCGNGGLDYEKDVKDIVRMLLDDRFRVITK